MPKYVVPLTDVRCRRATFNADGKNKLSDGGGLYLLLKPNGSKTWRMRYMRPSTGKESTLTFGSYPAVTLAAARGMRAEAAAKIAAGDDPADRPNVKPREDGLAADAFQALAEEWLALRRRGWSEGYYERMENSLKANAYPRFGRTRIGNISGKAVLDAVLAVQARGARDMAERVLSSIGSVFRYAVGTGRVHADVTPGLIDFLDEKPPVEHFPHVDVATLPELLERVRNYHGRPETRLAIQIMMRTFPRTNELRWGEWSELNRAERVWLIPPHRMKGTVMTKLKGDPHIIPLSSQVLDLFDELAQYTGRHRFMFPGMRRPATTPMSSETINKALKIMGYEDKQTGHGFRGLASTILNERNVAREDAIERQLAHKERNQVRRAYNHAAYLDERAQMMQWWSDFLDECAAKGRTQ
ncbi:tyrosine-type recombinase/integrase [Bordetella genomosp. 1]|nr:integrase arm-type DNA-binding domain-containing protein [Bordetella genomosp. 1]